MIYSSCEKLPGRLRDLCEGKGRDGRPDPSATAIAHWRSQFISQGINVPQRHRPSSSQRYRERVGSALKARISWFYTIKASSTCNCRELSIEMDSWGINGCESRREMIVGKLMENRDLLAESLSGFSAVHSIIGWALHTRLADTVLKKGANWLLDQALADVRSQPKPIILPRINKPAKQSPKPPLIGIPINRDKLVSHILYHIMPLSGETEWVWRRHCQWIREVRHLYNGRLIIGIVTPGLGDAFRYASPETVKEALDGLDAEFITAPNDTGRGRRKAIRQGSGEGVLFPQMLSMLKTSNPDEVAFYGHCKGVTRPNTPLDGAIHLWAEAMFETLFRNKEKAVLELDTHGICGSFRMPGGYRDGQAGIGSNWFFSGTFFGMRLIDVFNRNWSYLPTHYGCVEQWPRLNFDQKQQSSCLFFDNTKNLYDENYWKTIITPAFEKWKNER